MKKIHLLILLLGLSLPAFAQMKQGAVTYTMEFSSDNPDMAMGISMLNGSKMITYFMPGKTRSEVSMGTFGTNTTISDEKAKKTLMLMDMMGSKQAVETKIEDKKEDPEQPKIEVETTTETKEIMGYTCTKCILKMEDGTSMTAWCTKEIVVSTSGQSYYSSEMPGFPMEFEINQSEMVIKFTVTAIDKSKPSKKLFSMIVPEGYTMVSEEELKAMEQ